MSEGGCALILESEEHAADRGARLPEVAGYGASADAFHITAPDQGLRRGAVDAPALEDAAEEPRRSTTSSARPPPRRLNDQAETVAIKAALGEEIAHHVAVSSTKSMTGHMLGAAGAVEAAACALAIDRGVVPRRSTTARRDRTATSTTHERGARDARPARAEQLLRFGGQNATVAFRRA